MNKKGYTLIGFGLILYCINVSIPFVGIGMNKLSITFLPLSAIASFVLLAIGVRKVNIYRNDFKTASILFYVTAGLIFLASILIPLLSKNAFDQLFDLYYEILSSNTTVDLDETYLYLVVNIFKGTNQYMMLIFFTEIVAAVGTFIMLKGISKEKINLVHLKNLNASGKRTVIFNLITMVVSMMMIKLMNNIFSIALEYSSNSDVEIIINFFALIIIMPAIVVFAILTLVNRIKYIISIFKTPSNMIVEKEEVVDYTEE